MLDVSHLGRKTPRPPERWLFRDVTFSLAEGERAALVGPSGAGKSMLLRAVAALDVVAEGDVCFLGRPLSDWAMPEYRSRVMYLHQRPALEEATVEGCLMDVFRLKSHAAKRFSRARIEHFLTWLGRDGSLLERPTAALSGGELQMIAFLRALQLDPRVLLLDEPTASLDPESTSMLEALVGSWCEEDPARAYLWVTHDPQQAERVGLRALRLSEGRLVS